MERLDNGYLATLVERAKQGGSNAFAELYTATYQSVYTYSYTILDTDEECKEALKATFVQALKEINKLQDPELVVSWLYHLNFEICYGMKLIKMLRTRTDETDNSFELCKIDGRTYKIGQLSRNLPMTEAQVLIMHYYQGYSLRIIKQLLGLDRYTVKSELNHGKKHLKLLLGED